MTPTSSELVVVGTREGTLSLTFACDNRGVHQCVVVLAGGRGRLAPIHRNEKDA